MTGLLSFVGKGEEIAILFWPDAAYFMRGVQNDAFLSHPQQERVHYLHGVLRDGEYTFVVLCQESDAFFLEPVHRVLYTPSAQGTLHELFSSRIGLFELLDLFEGIGQIATAATCHSHLCQRSSACLEDLNYGFGHSSLQQDRTKAACRACSYNGNLHGFNLMILMPVWLGCFCIY